MYIRFTRQVLIFAANFHHPLVALITLTSDIGLHDYLVGAIKGQLLSANAAFQLVDISHQVTPFNYPEAAYVCRGAFRHFPAHTYHLVLVNLFDTPPDHLLLAWHNNQYILCADNGVLTMILEDNPEQVIQLPTIAGQQRDTLHCTQVMIQAIQALEAGTPMHQLGIQPGGIVEKLPLKPGVHQSHIEGKIIHIDRFENVVLNITRDMFETARSGRNFYIQLRGGGHITRISETYADVPQGDRLALFNAAGYLELAVNKGNIAGLLGLQVYNEKNNPALMKGRLFYESIRIFFE